MTIENLAEVICNAYIAMGFGLFFLCWFNLPVLIVLLFSRVARVVDRKYDLRATAPAHSAINWSSTLFFGIALPVFYFMATRTRSQLGSWNLASGVNSAWTIALGVICIVWLSAHLIEAMLRVGHIRFTNSWTNRIFGALALALCIWFQWHAWYITLNGAIFGPFSSTDPIEHFFQFWVFRYIYPSLCFGGATLVYGFAFIESLRPLPSPPQRRRWKIAIPFAVVLVGTIFSPFWLSIPRVTHRQAIALIDENRDMILKCAEEAKIDPRLIAGVIYVAQTRDHPRLFGDAMEELGLALWVYDVERYATFDFSQGPLLNASAGICQIRPTTAAENLYLIGLADSEWGAGKTPSRFYHPWRAALGDIEAGGTNNARSRFGHFSRIIDRCDSLLPLMVSSTGFATSYGVSFDMKRILLTPERNIALATLILAAYDQQWLEAECPIDDRPEILATLYNIGLRRSHPHSDPQANGFGRRVSEFMQSDACAEIFPEEGSRDE